MGGLEPEWLSIELESIENEIANWADGLRESLQASIEAVADRMPVLATRDPDYSFDRE